MDVETSYHHGDLRRALLETAREILRTKGVAGLSLRGVARAANVSHAAPYHHFKDKGALLAAVAEDGFRELTISVNAKSASENNPSLALQEAAIAYVVFAVEQPDLFRMMFGPHVSDKSTYPTLQAAAKASFNAIDEGIKRCAPADKHAGTPTGHLGVASWALIHGLAMLLIDKQLGPFDTAAVEQLTRHVTDVFWSGLSSDSARIGSERNAQ